MTVQQPRRLPRTVLALAATSFFTDVGSELVFSVMPLLLPAIGAGPAFLGLLEGFADATAALLKYLTGAWSDRLPKKRGIVLLGYALSSLTRPVLMVATAPWHVFALRVLDRVGKGVRTSPRDTLLAQAVDPSQAARAFGFHQAMDHAGAVVGPLLGAALLALGVDLRAVFLVALAPGLLSIASSSSFGKLRRRSRRRAQRRSRSRSNFVSCSCRSRSSRWASRPMASSSCVLQRWAPLSRWCPCCGRCCTSRR